MRRDVALPSLTPPAQARTMVSDSVMSDVLRCDCVTCDGLRCDGVTCVICDALRCDDFFPPSRLLRRLAWR